MTRVEGKILEAGPILQTGIAFRRSYVILVGGSSFPSAIFRNGREVKANEDGFTRFYEGEGGLRMFVDGADLTDENGAVPTYHFLLSGGKEQESGYLS